MTSKLHEHPSLSVEELQDKISWLVEELKARIFSITHENFKNPNCIDWRDIDNARPSIPWAWVWALGVILATIDDDSIDLDDVAQEVKNYFGWSLTGHTDNHQHKPNHQCQGCGHVERLITQWERYGLSPAISSILRRESDSVSSDNLDILEWGHEERNVFIVDIPGKWIISNTWEVQDFVYNVWYARELYGEIISHLQKTLSIKLDINNVMEIAWMHFMNTGWDLAQWKDVFVVKDINWDNIPEIDYEMTVPKKEAA